MEPSSTDSLSCPIFIQEYPQVLLAHGGGGTLTHQLIEKIFLPAFDNPALAQRHDGAVFTLGSLRLAMTTDSYVVHPLFFPGGDIGSLAVHGTVNDLAMCGAKPRYLSVGMIIEEGLSMETLYRITQSLRQAAANANVQIITGDTKVVDRGKGDGLFINTAGIGIIEQNVEIHPSRIQPGDLVLVNGDIGRHGMAIMAQREGLEFETTIESDSASIHDLVLNMLADQIEIHCLRDLTRGGLASALNEIASVARMNIHIREQDILVRDDVRSACEILGLDPLYVACEGRFVAFVAPHHAERALAIVKSHPQGHQARIIGEVRQSEGALVTLTSSIGSIRIVDMLSGEQLPRIC